MTKKYPEEVLTTSKKGKKEARILKERGSYTIYGYKELGTGKLDKKYNITLKKEDNSMEQYFVIPMQQSGRALMIHGKDTTAEVKAKKLWSEKEKKVVNV